MCNRVSSSAGADDLAETLTRRFSKYARFVETSREKKTERKKEKREEGEGKKGKKGRKLNAPRFEQFPFNLAKLKYRSQP